MDAASPKEDPSAHQVSMQGLSAKIADSHLSNMGWWNAETGMGLVYEASDGQLV